MTEAAALAGQDQQAAQPAQAAIGWPRAILTGVAVLVIGLGVSVVGADEIISRWTSLSRDAVSYVASGFFVVVVLAASWMVRRLQGRGVL